MTASHLRPLESWLDDVVMSWLRLLYRSADGADGSIEDRFPSGQCAWTPESTDLHADPRARAVLLKFR